MPGDALLLDTIVAIRRRFGPEAIRTRTRRSVPVWSTGLIELDEALRIGGLPSGRVVDLYGAPSSGKSTVLLQLLAALQEAGGHVAYIDPGGQLCPVRAHGLGVDLETLLVARPGSVEDAWNVAELLVRSEALDAVVLHAAPGRAGSPPVLVSQALRTLVAQLGRTQTLLVLVREGEPGGAQSGRVRPGEKLPGGRAPAYYASLRLAVTLEDAAGPEAFTCCVRIEKNKLGRPGAAVRLTHAPGVGFMPWELLVRRAAALGILREEDGVVGFRGHRIRADRLPEFFRAHPTERLELQRAVRGRLFG